MMSSVLRLTAWMGAVAHVPTVIIALRRDLPGIAVFDLLVLMVVVALHLSPGLPYRLRAALFCACPVAIGVMLLGPFGMYSQVFFLAAAVIAALLLGTRAGLAAAALGAVFMGAFGLLGLTGPETMLVPSQNSTGWWLSIAVKYALVTIVLTVGVGLVLSRLEQALADAIGARETAARQRELLRAFVDTVPDVVYSKDAEGRFRIFNAAALAMFGLTDEREITDKTVFDLYPRTLADRLHAEDLEVLAGRTVLNREVATRDADGNPQWYLTMKVPFRGPDGTVNGVIGISRNITDRKQLEEQLRQAQKMEAVGKLAGGVAHDFNNLLTIIVGFSEILRAESAAHPELLEPVDAISDAADRAAALTRQLLAFSRQTLLQPKVLDLNATISDTGRMLSRLIGENIRVTLVLDPTISHVRVDPGQFDQVLMNLAVNARDAMPNGGALTITTQEVHLSEALAARLEAPAGPHVMIAVTDSGVGMSADVMAHIFEPFFTTKAVGSGTGLGLAMAFGIVRQSGGSISVESEPGVGTTFRIYLPVVTDTLTPSEGSVPTPSLRGSETLLLVEDDAGVRELARRNLSAQGYDVLTAGDGREALRIVEVRQGNIALLVTDVVMPEMSGPELVAAIHGRWPELPVIYMSGYTSDAVVHLGIAASEVSFLQKPHTPLRLAHMVRAVLDSAATAPL